MESLAYPEQRSVLLTVMAGLCRCSAVGAACLLLVAACAPGDGPAEAPIPSPNVTKPASPGPTASTGLTPSPSPTTAAPSPLALATAVESFPDDPSGDSAAQAEVRAGWQEFERVIDKVVRDPDLKDLTETQYVTTGQEADDVVTGIWGLRDSNLRREGDLILRDAVISEPAINGDGVMMSEVRYCFDPKFMRTVDIDTGEQGGVEAIRPEDTMKVTVLMKLLPDGSWRAALTETELAPC